MLVHAEIDPAIGPTLDFLRDCSQRGKSAQECGRLAAEEMKRDICRQAWTPMDECLRLLNRCASDWTRDGCQAPSTEKNQ
jgi:hypothetical protein